MRRALMLCLMGAAACASPQYYYHPVEQATATISGHPAARYEIPPERPTGDVRVATFGIAALDFDEQTSIPALHVRLSVANNSGQAAWTFDAREVQAMFDGPGTSSPAFAGTDDPALPVLRIPRGQQRALDLYFPLLAALEGAEDIPRFDLLWSVHTDTRVITERTPFERIEIVPETRALLYYEAGLGFAPAWWVGARDVSRPFVVYRIRPQVRFVAPGR